MVVSRKAAIKAQRDIQINTKLKAKNNHDDAYAQNSHFMWPEGIGDG